MRATLALLLLAAAVCAAQAANTAGTSGRRLLQTPTTCPIANCKDAASCVYDSAKRSWTCRVCAAPFVPNAAKNACVCPAGQYPVSSGKCALCKLGFYCPLGTNPLRSTATRCPANMVTVKRGAASINDCLNAPGFKYLKTVSSVRAVACGDNEYSVGLAKQTACNKCPPGFETDPDNAPGDHTSSAMCLAPPGKFMTGESTSPCPVGEFSDSYSNATSCTTCEEALGSPGVTTAASGSTSKAACNWPMPGYILLDDKKKVITTAFDWAASPPGKIVSGAKLCPQSWYCQGGDPWETGSPATPNAGVPRKCFADGTEGNLNRLWTEKEGATSSTQCVAPPGYYLKSNLAVPPVYTVTECDADSYREGFSNATACIKCGADLWIADRTSYFNQLDAYGAVRKSWPVRGSPDVCYIQKGMGAVRDGAIGSVLKAILCPANTYGVVDKKYGLVVTPCTPCPTNLVTPTLLAANDAIKAPTYLAVDTVTPDTTAAVSTAIPFATDNRAYFSVAACVTQAGYGYYNGASQQCPKGYYNAAGNKNPCTQCPYGTTTLTTTPATDQNELADCNKYIRGFGLVNGVTDVCPIGTWQHEDVAVGTGSSAECVTCPSNHWTPARGAVDSVVTPAAPYSAAGDIVCSLCKPGYYSTNGGTACNMCSDGYFCPSTRTGTDVSATACPSGRAYTYTWETTEVYEPPATSIYGATTPDDCVALFAQTTDQSSFLNLPYTSATLTPKIADVLGLESCVEQCQTHATHASKCMGVTFSYFGSEPECRLLVATATASTSMGYAFKTMPSTNLAQSAAVKEKLGAKAMGTGYYTYWKVAPHAELDTALSAAQAAPAATSLVECEAACTNDPMCAGIKYMGYTTGVTITACYKIMSSSAVNTNHRTLIRAKFDQIGAKIAPGTFWDSALATPAIVPCTAGYECAGGDVHLAAAAVLGRSPCGAGTFASTGQTACSKCAVGTYAGATATSCTPCGTGLTSTLGAATCTILKPTFYSTDGVAAVACPTNFYCPGMTMSGTSAQGSTACTTGTCLAGTCSCDTYAASCAGTKCTPAV